MMEIEPGTAGRGASLLPLCFAAPPPPPLLAYLHSSFLDCLTNRPDHLSFNSIQLQVRFLHEVSEARESNKMDSRSLAIVFTPCIFPVEEEDFAGSKGSDSRTAKSLDVKVEVVQTLINNASKVGCAQYGCQMTKEVVGSNPAATDSSFLLFSVSN